MKITKIDEKDGRMAVLIEKARPDLVNAIRRTVIDEVPTMAVDEVEFRSNDSVMYDEMLAHRIGLVPLTTDLKSYELPDGETPTKDLPAKQMITFTCKAKGPALVTSKDLKSKDPSIKPVFDNIPLVKLLDGQELEFEARATLGRGRDHAKWSPALAFFKQKPSITVKQQPDSPEDFVKAVPHGLLQVKSGKVAVDEDVLLKNPLASDAIDSSDVIEIEHSPEDYVLYIESWGQLDPKEILQHAVDLIEARIDSFEKEFKATA